MADGETEPGTVIEQEHEHAPASTEAAGHPSVEQTQAAEETETAGSVVEVKGQRMVPVEQLAEARKDKRFAKEKLEATEAELTTLRTFADQAQPILQRIQSDPELLEAVKAGRLPDRAPETEDTSALAELAKTLDLFDASGKPDLARAQKLNDLVQAHAKTLVDAQIKPLADRTAEQQSTVNLERLKQMRLPDGTSVDPSILDSWFAALGAEKTQDPNVANTALMQSIGHQVLTGKKFSRPVSAPIVTDTAGGRTSRVELDTTHKKIAKELGVSTDSFQQGIEAVQTRNGVLEEY